MFMVVDIYLKYKMKDKFNHIYDNYGHIILWTLLAIQAIAVAIASYN